MSIEVASDIEELQRNRVKNLNESIKERQAREKHDAEAVEDFGEQLKEQAIRRGKKDINWYMKQLQADIGFYFLFFWDIELSYKQHVLLDSYLNNRHSVGIFARQTGKTLAGAGGCQRDLAFEPNTKIGLYAPTQNQAINVGFGTLRELIFSQPILENQVNEIKKSGFIKYNNGNEFRAHTANKDANIRGFSPSVIWCDETQDLNDETYNADILASGGAIKGVRASKKTPGKKTKVLETGTPKGRNHFFKVVRPIPVIIKAELKNGKIIKPGYITPTIKAESGATIVWQPWWEGHPDVVDLEWLESRRLASSLRLFEQEYCCVFNFDEGYAFNYKHILRAARVNDRGFKRVDTKLYGAGIDLGRNQDHTVLSIYRAHRDTHARNMVLHVQWGLNEEWRIIFAEIMDYLDYWRPQLTIIDGSGIGEPIYDTVFRPSKHTCMPWKYGLVSKNDLMRNTESLMERDRVGFWNDEQLIWQMRDAPMVMMESGIPKYPKPDDNHDDRVQSNVLALMATSKLLDSGRKIVTHVDASTKEFTEFLDTVKPPTESRGGRERRKSPLQRKPRIRRDEWRQTLFGD